MVYAITTRLYTYTCEEGKFQIDVPEGWEVQKGTHAYYDVINNAICLLRLNEHIEGNASIVIVYLDINNPKHREIDLYRLISFSFNADKNIYNLHDQFIRNLENMDVILKVTKDEFLDKNEITNMNVESGFVIFFEFKEKALSWEWAGLSGIYVKGDMIYFLVFFEPKEECYVYIKDDVINTLNSFYALD